MTYSACLPSRRNNLSRRFGHLAVALAVLLVMGAPLPVLAQDAAQDGAQTPVIEQAPDIAPALPVQGTGEAAPEAGGTTGAPAAAQTPGSEVVPPAADGDAGLGEAISPAEPAPSFLENPAGAISNLMTQAERDPGLPHDLSPWGMFLMADWVVKSVMIGLILASIAVWTVWLAKSVEIAGAKARARRAVNAIASSSNLAEASLALSNRGGPAAFMVQSAQDEMRRSAVALDHAGNDGVKERLGARLARIEAQASRRLSRGTGLLATVGSTAPFVGLFATVWGIMNSFIGISEAQTTNLAVVAPGIAEALLATAVGLVAAIPAVIIYNVFARSITGYGQLLADAASGVEQLVSLDLDLRKVPANDPGSPASSPAPALAAE